MSSLTVQGMQTAVCCYVNAKKGHGNVANLGKSFNQLKIYLSSLAPLDRNSLDIRKMTNTRCIAKFDLCFIYRLSRTFSYVINVGDPGASSSEGNFLEKRPFFDHVGLRHNWVL